jgi:glycosyltransferase involved in cell wall biosynthesis
MEKLDIVFYIETGLEAWMPDTMAQTAMGGTDLILMEQAKRLVALGHRIRVYSNCSGGTFDGVTYYSHNDYHDLSCDVLVISQHAPALGDQFNIDAKLKLLWLHNIFVIGATNELLLKADRILALSEWHRQNIINQYCVHPKHVMLTRLGVDLKLFDRSLTPVTREPYKCVNISAPERSWPVLLSLWSKIKWQVPQAELHLYYGFKNWEITSKQFPGQPELIEQLKMQIRFLEPFGVIYHDRVSQEKLAEELLSADVMLYPTWYPEVGNLSGMLAQTAGVRVVSSNITSFGEIVGDRGTLIDGEWTSPEYQKNFVKGAVRALTNINNYERTHHQKYAQEHFGLDALAKDWEQMFYQLIEDKKVNPIVSYMPTPSYLEGSRGYWDGDPRFGNHNREVTL